jgi:hypothetical protein
MHRHLTLLLLAVGCGVSRAPESPKSPPPPLSERRTYAIAANLVQLFGSCDAYGSKGCASGLCLRTGPSRTEGHLCTRQCTNNAECGSGRCVQLYPSRNSRFCVPHLSERPDGGRTAPNAAVTHSDAGVAFGSGGLN